MTNKPTPSGFDLNCQGTGSISSKVAEIHCRDLEIKQVQQKRSKFWVFFRVGNWLIKNHALFDRYFVSKLYLQVVLDFFFLCKSRWRFNRNDFRHFCQERRVHLAPRNRFRLRQAVPWIFNKNQPASACIQWFVISEYHWTFIATLPCFLASFLKGCHLIARLLLQIQMSLCWSRPKLIKAWKPRLQRHWLKIFRLDSDGVSRNKLP